MSRSTQWKRLTVLAAAMGTGCQSESYLGASQPEASGASDLVQQLSREASEIAHLLGFRQIVLLALLVLLVWATTRILGAMVRFAWRVGIDPKSRLATVRSAANVIIAGWAAYAVLRQFLAAAPLSTLLALAVAASASLMVFSGQTQNLWAGVVLSFRRTLREGDRVVIGEHTGIVREIGLSRLQIRCGDGASVLIPNRFALQEPLRVERAKNSVPVVVRAKLPDAPPAESAQLARATAILSPYRANATPVEVTEEADGTLRVEIQVWSERALRDAETHLETAVHAALRAEHAPVQDSAKRPRPTQVQQE